MEWPSHPVEFSQLSRLPESRPPYPILLDIMGDVANPVPVVPGIRGGSGTEALPDILASESPVEGSAAPERPTSAPAFVTELAGKRSGLGLVTRPLQSRIVVVSVT